MQFSGLQGRICSRNAMCYWLLLLTRGLRREQSVSGTAGDAAAVERRQTHLPSSRPATSVLGLCGPNGVHSAGLFGFRVRSLAHSAHRLPRSVGKVSSPWPGYS